MKRRPLLSLTAVAALGVLALTACSGGLLRLRLRRRRQRRARRAHPADRLEGLLRAVHPGPHHHAAPQRPRGVRRANTKLVGSANVRQALENDEFLGYWEYTGTSWITYNGNTAPVPGAEAQFTATKEADAAKGIAWLDPRSPQQHLRLRDPRRQGRGVGREDPLRRRHAPANEQTFCIESEFSTRDDGWPGLKTAYGLNVPDSNVPCSTPV